MGTVHQIQPVRNNFSSNRFFNVASDGWYVEVREGIKGPFFYRKDAEIYLETIRSNAPGRARLWKERASQ